MKILVIHKNINVQISDTTDGSNATAYIWCTKHGFTSHNNYFLILITSISPLSILLVCIQQPNSHLNTIHGLISQIGKKQMLSNP